MEDQALADARTVNRCPGESWEEIIASDAIPPPAFLGEDRYQYLGSEPLAASRYYDAEFHRAEIEKMWPNVWQFAAREEDMPEPGDYVTYENAGRSYLLARQADGSVKAFHNVCLHRGRKLKTDSGKAKEFFCPFHGFSWNTNGSIKNIPCRWDFDHLSDDKMQLPEASLAQWGGYIFVRQNAEGPSIEEYLKPLPEFFQQWRHEDCVTIAWVGKVIKANWKVTMEAFMESYHAYITHPQILPFTGDANAAYHVLGPHTNVNYTPFATLSPHIDSTGKSEQWIVDQFIRFNGRSVDNIERESGGLDVQVAAGQSARKALGAALRTSSAQKFGGDYSQVSESELMDALVYNVFPNFAPWGGFMPNVVYRWRPWPDQDHCLMEVRLIARAPDKEPLTRGAAFHLMGETEKWADAPELGTLGAVLDQDTTNMELVHEGLKCSINGNVELGDYQEVRIRHFHQVLDRYLNAV
jgi:nitrite reductase/ring-hydroxylating ferredoxin subunit